VVPANFHGSAVILGDRGLLITGPSGSGKTGLARVLVDRWRAGGRFGRLVADDQVFIARVNGRAVATVPPAIQGLVEVRGVGPVPVPHEPRAAIDLVVRLVAAAAAPRMGGFSTERLAGCEVPRLDLPERDILAAVAAVSAWLSRPPPDQLRER
jgi:serine kinase of HPr protein (carbohydrate metabolism regulator)